MRVALLRTALLLGSALCAGCQSQAAPAPAATSAASASPSAAPRATSAADESPITIARRLALSKPGGTTPVDVEIEKLQKSLETTGQASDPWVLLGRAWVRKARDASDPGYYLNAKACADVALDLAPSNRAATNLVGVALINQHRFDDARDLAQQILQKAPEDRMALGTLSDAYLEVGRYAEAQAAAQKMMDMKPNLPSYVRASYLEWLRGDDKAALESIKAAIDAGRDPKDPEPRCWAMVQAAMIFWHKGDYPGADAGFTATLKECSDYPPALVGRARVAMAKDEPTRAAELLTLAWKQSPLTETAWLLGDARAAGGDAKGAEEAYAQAVKQGKGSDPRTLALFYATKDRDRDEAVKLAQEEIKVRQDIYTQEALAWALYRAGKIPEAKAAAEKMTALGTKDARLLYHAGAIKIAAGDKAAGEKLVKDALALNPKFDWTGASEASKLVGK
jgi:tetratricopeptide (TPR) repeat protein